MTLRLSVWTFNKFIYGNVGAPTKSLAQRLDRADRVIGMRHQELLFSASDSTPQLH